MNLWYNARHRHRLKLHPLYRTCIPKPKNFPDTHKATSSKTSPRCWHSRRSLVHPSVSHTAKSLLDRILVSKMCLSYNIPYNSQVHVTTKLDYHISNEVWKFPAFLDCPDIAFLPIHNTRQLAMYHSSSLTHPDHFTFQVWLWSVTAWTYSKLAAPIGEQRWLLAEVVIRS